MYISFVFIFCDVICFVVEGFFLIEKAHLWYIKFYESLFGWKIVLLTSLFNKLIEVLINNNIFFNFINGFTGKLYLFYNQNPFPVKQTTVILL